MQWPGLAGVVYAGRGQNVFPVPAGNAAGNNLPGITGRLDIPYGPGPGPSSGGQLGGIGDGQNGADPRAPKMSPAPHVVKRGWAQERQHRSYGINGFNDQLTVKDRHAYWDTGTQRTGTTFTPASSNPNAYNNPLQEPPRPDLRLVNRTVSYQKGSDHTINQDDFTRPYTWLGEQGSGWAPIYGGVQGLYQPYGTRGGVPLPIVSPAPYGGPGDGPGLVWSGPPHGLHSQTPWKGAAQINARFASTPQTRPVRQDRPSNSPQAGQSYSQTVLPQGASPVRPQGRAGFTGQARRGGQVYGGGRGWGGQFRMGAGGSQWGHHRGGSA